MNISKKTVAITGLVAVTLLLFPELGFCDLVDSLGRVQSVLVTRLAPIVGILSICFAGFSYLSGNPNSRSHLLAAVIGSGLCFGAETILRFIQQYVK